MWDRVVGQERAVGLLQRAAERPVHAYLLVGPRGAGLEDAARCFAAEVVAPDHDQRVQDLVLRGMHPDVVEFEPEGNQILVAQAEAVIREAHRAPIEAEHKVVAVFEADRLNEQASNKLLKTIEEPPARSTIMLVTSSPDELLETVRSRCQRIDLAPLPEAALRDALVHEHADPEAAGPTCCSRASPPSSPSTGTRSPGRTRRSSIRTGPCSSSHRERACRPSTRAEKRATRSSSTRTRRSSSSA